MGFLNRVLGGTKPVDVFSMPDNPSDFIAQLSRRKFWRDIDAQVLHDIAHNADGNMERLRCFVFVSEHCGLVSGNFVKLARKPGIFCTPLAAFSQTLYNLGSSLSQRSLQMRNAEEREIALRCADMAFTSAVLCDPVQLPAYGGMAFLYGTIHVSPSVAVEWCRKYKDAEDALLATPDERLTAFHRTAKHMIEAPDEDQELLQQIADRISGPLGERLREPEDRPMREIIEELEQRLMRSE